MNVLEKRDFIKNHLHLANESTINEFYQKLRDEEVLKEKLESRALKSERDIQSGRVFSRAEVEQMTGNAKITCFANSCKISTTMKTASSGIMD
jgi:hypothetical protein